MRFGHISIVDDANIGLHDLRSLQSHPQACAKWKSLPRVVANWNTLAYVILRNCCKALGRSTFPRKQHRKNRAWYWLYKLWRKMTFTTMVSIQRNIKIIMDQWTRQIEALVHGLLICTLHWPNLAIDCHLQSSLCLAKPTHHQWLKRWCFTSH